MCGRFAVTFDPSLLEHELGLDEPPPHLPPRFNVAPTQTVAAVANVRPRRLDLFHWGLIPWWAKDRKIAQKMINARGETLNSRGAFKEALKKRRCLIPADGFYEWRRSGEGKAKRKQPFLIRRKDGRPFAFAGLWDLWASRETGEETQSLTIVTIAPNELVAKIHDRMPVMLLPEQFDAWLAPELSAEDAAKLLRPIAAEELEMFPVSSRVNDVENDDEACAAPVDPDAPPPEPAPAKAKKRPVKKTPAGQLSLFPGASAGKNSSE